MQNDSARDEEPRARRQAYTRAHRQVNEADSDREGQLRAGIGGPRGQKPQPPPRSSAMRPIL